MTTKSLFVAAVLASVLLGILYGRKQQRAAVSPERITLHKQFAAPPKAFSRPPPPGVPSNAVHLVLVLPEGLTDEARAATAEAVRTFELFELEKRRFDPNSLGPRMVEGMQRKLWLDDYVYAAAISGGKDCSQASASYSNLVSQVRNLSTEELNRLVHP